jgi:hypothetical protein
VSVSPERTSQDRSGRAGQPGGEGDRGDHDRLGGQDLAAARRGGERGADQAAPVLGGDEHRSYHERHDQPGEHPGDAGVGGPAAARGVPHGGRDVTRSLHRKDPPGLAVPAGQGVVRGAGAEILAVPLAAGPGPGHGDVVEDSGGEGDAGVLVCHHVW